MATLTETRHTAGFISSEANGNRSRLTVTVDGAATTSAGLASGTVMGKVTSGGKYIAYVDGASDGSGVAAGILIEALDKGTADSTATVIARDAEINEDEITGSDTSGKDELEALGIVYR
jgi:hypothetical protein